MSRAYNTYVEQQLEGEEQAEKARQQSLSAADDAKRIEDNIHDYYGSLRKYVDRVGDWAWIYKLEKNCEDGVYQAQKVRYDYFGTEAALQQEKQSRRQDVMAAAKKFNLAAERLGLPRMSDHDIKLLTNFLLDSANRDYFRKRSKSLEGAFKPVSLLEIYEKRRLLNSRRLEKQRKINGEK